MSFNFKLSFFNSTTVLFRLILFLFNFRLSFFNSITVLFKLILSLLNSVTLSFNSFTLLFILKLFLFNCVIWSFESIRSALKFSFFTPFLVNSSFNITFPFKLLVLLFKSSALNLFFISSLLLLASSFSINFISSIEFIFIIKCSEILSQQSLSFFIIFRIIFSKSRKISFTSFLFDSLGFKNWM